MKKIICTVIAFAFLANVSAQIVFNQRGKSSQVISGSEFATGIYLYALIADGQEVDVKRMILTE